MGSGSTSTSAPTSGPGFTSRRRANSTRRLSICAQPLPEMERGEQDYFSPPLRFGEGFGTAADHAPPGPLDPIIAERRHPMALPPAKLELATHPGCTVAVARVDNDRTYGRQCRQDLGQIPARSRVADVALFGVEVVIQGDQP